MTSALSALSALPDIGSLDDTYVREILKATLRLYPTQSSWTLVWVPGYGFMIVVGTAKLDASYLYVAILWSSVDKRFIPRLYPIDYQKDQFMTICYINEFLEAVSR